MNRKLVSIYAKGTAAARDMPGYGGYAVQLCHNDKQKQLSGGFRFTTEKRMNIMATVAGLDALKTPCMVQLYTNCKHLDKVITNEWLHDWKANGWRYGKAADGIKESTIENADLWDRLSELCDRHTVESTWIENLSTCRQYEKCDEILKHASTSNALSNDDGYFYEILVKLDNRSALNVLLSELPPEILLDYAGKARASGRDERAQELESRGKQRAAQERRAKEKQTLLEQLRRHFKHDFLSAGNFYQGQCSTHISPDEYEDEKIGYILSWAKEKNLNPMPDREQAAAIGAVEGNVQVVARAGSGKTATLVNRALFLQEHCDVSPDEMLLLAFNKKAADEMRKRLASYLQASTPHVMTFHALAYAIVHPDKILYDEREGEQSQSRVLQTMVDHYLHDPSYFKKIRALMMAHFHTDWERINSGGYNLSPEEMVRYRRSLPLKTLNGEDVKSYGEKAIANFLFEHDIHYRYEPLWWWDDEENYPYHPDFTIPGQNVAIEYFGLREDPDYDNMSEEKRNYWRNKPKWRLLEYSPLDVGRGEADFYALFKHGLDANGISCVRLSDNQIWHQIKDRAIDDFTEVIRGFIQRCRKLSLTVEQLSQRIQAHNCISDVEQHFLDLVQDFYRSYLKRFDAYGSQRPKEEDFDGLVQRAAKIIENGETNCHYTEKIARPRPRTCNLKHVRYVFIDEYQDFSKLFYRLTTAIRERNARARLFCVGDDWQAINGFAGSDIHYFENFSEVFEGNCQLNVSTNYRSVSTVVDVGNALMHGRGTPARGHTTDKGRVVIADLHTFPLARILHEKYPSFRDYPTHALLRLVRKIIDNGKTVALLSRINSEPWSVNYGKWGTSSSKRGLDRFLAALRARLPHEHKKKVTISTVHSYKGREENTVIVLDATDRRYPLLHPNWFFTRVLGDNVERLTDEERRLFYVALTRAKEELYILTENVRISPFLVDLERNIELSRLNWSDYPPLESTDITIKVGNQNGRGQTPTKSIVGLLKAEDYRWDGSSNTWHSISGVEDFCVTRFANQARWSRRADGVEVRFCDYLDKVLAKYHINTGKWECIFDNMPVSGGLTESKKP